VWDDTRSWSIPEASGIAASVVTKISTPVSSDYEAFLFIRSLWERRATRGDMPLVDWFKKEVTRLPKWLGKQEHRHENPLRVRLTKHWYFLRKALEEVQRLKPGQIRPYIIAQRFLEESAKAAGKTESILANRERITS
jgi:hypothetical protein